MSIADAIADDAAQIETTINPYSQIVAHLKTKLLINFPYNTL